MTTTSSPIAGPSGSSQSPPPQSINEHLSFPSLEPDPAAESSGPSSQPRQVLRDRLYIGNLHPSVDEYSLLQVFSKFGKVTHLDFLFHKAGVLKGKPRGYAFIEYGSNDEALKALSMAHDKLLRGRKLVVTFAHQAPIEACGSGSLKRRGMMETGRPTALSIIKTGMKHKGDGTKDKIAMMEAKLLQMEAAKPKTPDETQTDQGPSTSASGSLPHHPSLPAKPPPQIPKSALLLLPGLNQQQPPSSKQKSSTHTPSLPTPPSPQSLTQTILRPAKAAPALKPKTRLVGVKIGKTKEKVSRSEDS